MAEKDFASYRATGIIAVGDIPKTRTIDVYVDFSVAANQLAGATDNLNLFELPSGATVVAAGIEQVTAGTGSGTFVARVGSVTVSGTLASTATAGTLTATVPAALPTQVGAAADFNLLGATAVRADGIVRAWVEVLEATRAYPHPTVAARDTSTGLA